MVFESVFRSNFHKATGKLKHAPPRPHLFQLQQAKLFGAQGSFRPAFDYTLTIHPSEVVAYGFALVAEALGGEFEEGFRIGHGRSEEHTLNSSHLGISYAVFCLKK